MKVSRYTRTTTSKDLAEISVGRDESPFEIALDNDETLLSEEEFYSKIDKSIEQAQNGRTKVLSKEAQKELLGL